MSSWTPYNASLNEDNKPSSSDYIYSTLDIISLVGSETVYTHEQFYEQTFDKADGSIDDPALTIYTTTIYDPSYTVKIFSPVRIVGSERNSFYSSYDFLAMPRLNGAAALTMF